MDVNILVCDDDREIAESIKIYLEREGYNTFMAYNGKQALAVIEEQNIHLVLIDVMMPVMNGLSAIIKIREKMNVPIIVLSAKNENSDKVIGLNMGADDYISKPFSQIELVARVKSQIRRFISLGNHSEKENTVRSGGLSLDDEEKTVKVDNVPIDLTPIEYNIVRLLLSNKGKVYTIKEIYANIWNEPMYCSDSTVAVHIRHIREKIEVDPKEPKYLKVVWGQGYKIERLD